MSDSITPVAKITVQVDLEDIKAGLEKEDIVNVIRCKDCKHRYHPVECPCQSYDHFYSWMPADDWFCKKGERKAE